MKSLTNKNFQLTLEADLSSQGCNEIINRGFANALNEYISTPQLNPLLFNGNAAEVLATLPDECIDCVMTSPPYWGKREYKNGGIGLESKPHEYIDALAVIFLEINIEYYLQFVKILSMCFLFVTLLKLYLLKMILEMKISY